MPPQYLHVTQGFDAVLALFPLAGRDLDSRLNELGLEVGDGVFGARVGPDNRLAQRLARFAAPCDGGLALVGDA